ncbi:ABC transporter substrate-binding protein [Cohnella hongkongensis]|uniref:ABC transporter substrate-binding protein n=1 Tax=Cohnella hongkongensis TaxID=178337 RepID=A0ABV9FL23_9BACL
MSKKMVSLLIGIIVLLTACSLPQNSSTGESGADKEVTLRFSWWGGESRHKATLAAIDLYMEQNPDVKIEGEYSSYDGFYQKLLTQFAGNTAPDIMQIDHLWINDLISQGELLVDLDSMKDVVNLDGFDQQFLRDWAFLDDKLQAIPAGINVSTGIMNETFMEREGLPIDADWTWEMIVEEGKKVHDKNPNMYLLNSDLITIADKIVPAYYNQLTGKHLVNADNTIAFDVASMAETFSFVKLLYDEGIVEPLGESALYNAKTEQNPKWINGEAGITLANSSDIIKHRNTAPEFKISSTLFPIMQEAKESGISPKPAGFIGINKNSKHVQEAAKFVDWFFNNQESILLLGVERSLPAMSASQKLLVDHGKMDQVVMDSVQKALEHRSSTPAHINFNQELYKIMSEVVEKVAFGKSTPEEAAAELLERYEAKLKEIDAQTK